MSIPYATRLLIQEPPLQVLPTLAKVLKNVEDAIVLQQIQYWTSHPNSVEKDGRRWCYSTFDKWLLQFPWMSMSTLKRIVARLEKMNLIISREMNRSKGDRTKWYSIDQNCLEALLHKACTHSVNLTQPLCQSDTTIVSNWHDVRRKENIKENIKEKENKDHSKDDQLAFDRLWKEFEKKVAKGRARIAFKAALKKVSVDTMIEALRKQKEWRKSKGPKDFVPDWKHPASWLNGECWADELDVPATKKPTAVDQYAYLNNAPPRMHKTEEETKQELERVLPKERASPQHVSGVLKSLKSDLATQNMETGNVRNHGRGIITTVEQRHRDGGEDFIASGCA